MTQAWHRGGEAPGDVMAELERLRGMIRSLAAERNDLAAALRRHTQWFTTPRGMKVCAGCLEESPCPAAGLLSAEVPSP